MPFTFNPEYHPRRVLGVTPHRRAAGIVDVMTPTNRSIAIAAGSALALSLALTGCSFTTTTSTYRYEVSSTAHGTEASYTDPATKTGTDTVTLTDTTWTHTPNPNPNTNTDYVPKLTVIAPAAADATCRIIEINNTTETVITEKTATPGGTATCERPAIKIDFKTDN